MKHVSAPSLRRVTSWTGLLCLLLLAFTLAACGDSGAATTTTGSGGSSNTPAASATTSTVTITEQTGGNDIYAFAPTTLSIKAGDSIKWVNNSDENHLLASKPASVFSATSVVMRSGSNDNTLTMTFSTAGTYTISSQLVNRLKDGLHTPDPADSKAILTITVTG